MVGTKVESVTLVGRRWFNKSKGNTYHSCEIFVNGRIAHKIEYAYGYGQQYEDSAKNWLTTNGYLSDIEKHEPLWSWTKRNNVALVNTVTDVQRKKDL